MTTPMTTPMTMPVAVTGPPPVPAVLIYPADTTAGRAGGCSNCGSVHSVRVLPDGRHRCGCGHRWTPRTARRLTGQCWESMVRADDLASDLERTGTTPTRTGR